LLVLNQLFAKTQHFSRVANKDPKLLAHEPTIPDQNHLLHNPECRRSSCSVYL
jgi:hypothetical protein